jgi:hypothetical protein
VEVVEVRRPRATLDEAAGSLNSSLSGIRGALWLRTRLPQTRRLPTAGGYSGVGRRRPWALIGVRHLFRGYSLPCASTPEIRVYPTASKDNTADDAESTCRLL